jgi:HK97 family phage major capsid protein
VALGGGLGALQEIAFTTGSGTNQPLGLVNAGSPFTVSTAPTGNVSTFSRAAILQFYLALAPEYRANATWLLHPTDFGNLAALTGTDTGLIFPALQESPPSLFGRPVVLNSALPTPAASAKSLVFASMKEAYAVRRVQGIRVTQLTEKYSDNGQVGFKALERVDGRPLLSAAAIIGAHSAT